MTGKEIIAAGEAVESNSSFFSKVLDLAVGPTRRAEAQARYNEIMKHAHREEEKRDLVHYHEMRLFQQSLDDRTAANLTQIIAKAEGYSEGKIDPESEKNGDWFHSFFDYAKFISDIEIQEIWARILSQELEFPESFSLRTLQLLKTISKKEALIFLQFISGAKCLIFNEGIVNPSPRKDQDIFLQLNNPWTDIQLLIEIGLVDSTYRPEISFDFVPEINSSRMPFFKLGENIYRMGTKKPSRRSLGMTGFKLTYCGREVQKIASPKFENVCLERIKNFISYNEYSLFISELGPRFGPENPDDFQDKIQLI